MDTLSAYSAAAWHDFYAALAGAAAALTGLLFVAVSLNPAGIARRPALRARAREALFQLLVLVVLALVVLIPGQRPPVLGGELLALGLASEAAGTYFQAGTVAGLPAPRRPRWLLRLLPLHLATLALPAAGASLLLGRGGGLAWLTLTVLVYLIWSTTNTWSLVMQTGTDGVA